MTRPAVFSLAMLLLLATARGQNCVSIAYWTGYPVVWAAGFPVTDGGNVFNKVAYHINPTANGNVQSLRVMLYNNNLSPVVPHNGTLRVWAYSDNAGAPDAIVAGPLDFSTNGFAAVYGAWDEVSLVALNYNFSANTPFHIVWQFLPQAANHKLDLLGVNGAGFPVGSQMFNSTLNQWGWWFTTRGDAMEEVSVCYTTTPPGSLDLSGAIVDMGRIENGVPSTENFRAYNHGGMNTTVTAIAITNPTCYSASVAGGLPRVLTPGDSLSFSLTFNSGATTVFRDTTSVDFAWTSNAVAHHTYFFAIAGSSECTLTNDWTGSPGEPDWHVAAYGDSSIYGGTWQLFPGGLNRNAPFAGHGWTAQNDTASAELYTFLDNANLDDITWRYAYTQDYPADVVDHRLLVYGIENDTLSFLYGFDVTGFSQSSPVWAHLTASLDSLPDSLACSFYYGGSYADSWFIDDVEFCRSCSAIPLGIAYQGGNLTLSWPPFPGETVRIWQSGQAYDFGAATLAAIVPSAVGGVSLPAVGSMAFYRAVRDCQPPPALVQGAGLRRIHRHPDGISKRAIRDLVPLRMTEQGRLAPPAAPVAEEGLRPARVRP